MRRTCLVVFCLMVFVVINAVVSAAPYDFGGQTVRISGTFPDSSTFGINFEDARGLGHIRDVEEMFNVKIEWVYDDSPYNPQTFIANVLAGDPVADIQLLDRERAFFQIAAEGLLTPLNDILDEEYWENIPRVYQAREHFMFGDKLYGFSLIDVGGWAIFWNKTLWERDGLPDPYELIESGQWTWDTLREIAKAATRDTDGDGIIDQYGISIDESAGAVEQIGALLASNNAAIGKYIDGRVVYTLDEPEAIEAIEFLQTLIHVDKTAIPENMFTFLWGERAMALTHPWWFFYCGDPQWMKDDAGILPYPAGPNGDPGQIYSYSAWNWNWTIPVTTKHDPRALIELYNALYMASYDYVIDDPEERLVNDFARYVNDRRDLEIYRGLISNLRLAPYFNDFFISDYRGFFGDLIFGNKDPKATTASIKSMMQTRFDEIFNNR